MMCASSIISPEQVQPHPIAVGVQRLNKSFGEGENRVHVLHDIDLTLPSGSMNYIVGPSG